MVFLLVLWTVKLSIFRFWTFGRRCFAGDFVFFKLDNLEVTIIKNIGYVSFDLLTLNCNSVLIKHYEAVNFKVKKLILDVRQKIFIVF